MFKALTREIYAHVYLDSMEKCNFTVRFTSHKVTIVYATSGK